MTIIDTINNSIGDVSGVIDNLQGLKEKITGGSPAGPQPVPQSAPTPIRPPVPGSNNRPLLLVAGVLLGLFVLKKLL